MGPATRQVKKSHPPFKSTSPQLRPLTESCFSSGVIPWLWKKLVKVDRSYMASNGWNKVRKRIANCKHQTYKKKKKH